MVCSTRYIVKQFKEGIILFRAAVPALVNAGPDCYPCGGPLKVTVQRGGGDKKLTSWYINISCKIIIKSVRELCVVSQCVFLEINNTRIPRESGAPIVSNRSNRPKVGHAGKMLWCNKVNRTAL
jgi:hypothetical protein